MLSETHPIIRIRRRLGRVKRWVKRRWWERKIGREYRAWLSTSGQLTAGSDDNALPISVIVPVFNPPVEFLRECLESVLNQTARNWQLVVSDDGSTDPQVRAYLDAFTLQYADDPRIAVLHNPNGGISAAQNHALALVTNPYFGWLDHDDLLHATAISEFSNAITAHPGHVLVTYSDEDKVDTHGRHFELYCKPNFAPELLLTQMYLCHFTVFETNAVRNVGAFRSEFDGAQDFDLALRLLPQLTSRNVIHIPRPLYHWRAWAQSTADSIDAKPWAQEASASAQRAFLSASGRGGHVTPSSVKGLNDVRPEITPARVSVVIPTAGTHGERGERYVDAAVRSLRESPDGAELEIILVTTGKVDPVQGVDHVVPYPGSEFNFARAINAGCAVAAAEYVLLLNDDTELVTPDSIHAMLELAQDPGVGAVGAKLTYPDGRLQHVGMILLPTGPTHPFIGKPGSAPGYFGSTLTPRNYSAVTAAAMLVRAEAFAAVGGFDEVFARDFNDVDFCLRLRDAGYRIAWTPYAWWTHHEGVSLQRRQPDAQENALFRQRWGHAVPDPYYSPALHDTIDRLYEAR